MSIAFKYPTTTEQLAPVERSSDLPRLARFEVFDTIAAAERFWRQLEDGDALFTSYQSIDLLAAWQHHVGTRAGVKPFIVTGFDAHGEPLFLWPFGRAQKGPFRIVRFLGSKHSNFNMGLWRRDILSSITQNEIRAVLADLSDEVDMVGLCNQPLTWDGAANPFALLPRQPAADMSARQSLVHQASVPAINDILSTAMRSRLRNKERKLQKLPGYRYVQPREDAEIDRLLDRFFCLKASHMAAQGLDNVFADPGIPEFLRSACHHKLANGRPLIELHALEVNGEVLALFGTIVDRYRCSSMFNTYTLGENARHSPGLILLVHMINEFSARGVRTFDIGVGRAHYKSFFCREPEPLFESFIGLTPRGLMLALAFASVFSMKRLIKRNPALWAAVQLLRRLRART
ncbi:MAG TPA: GNAT family N-acetyltransferase [Xanthobacteraceae bacterium]|jgi:CelD/BcsL family acetyltransferase involved in cellulose biosynthesis